MKRRIFDFIPFYIHFYVSQDRPDHSAWQSQVWCHGKPTQATCKYHLSATQPDLHLQSTELYLRLDWPPPHLQTENGCISQHCHHPHHLPSRAGRQHISARHDHHLPCGPPGPHSHQWPGKLASVIQRVFLFFVWQWIHLGLVMANVGPDKHPEQYYVHRWDL